MKPNIYNLILFTSYTLVLFITDIRIIVLISGIMAWVFFYFINHKYINKEEIIISALIYSTPYSFLSISGKDYSASILSWYNIILLLMTMYFIREIMKKRSIHISKAYLYLGFWAISIIVVLFTHIVTIDAIAQSINIFSVIIAIVIGLNYKYLYANNSIKIFYINYIISSSIVSMFVIIQFLIYHIYNKEIANVSIFGVSREAFGLFFNDFSFLSVYLSLGLLLTYFLFKDNKMIKIIISILLLVGSILTSARTGIFSFLITIFIITILKNYKSFLIDRKRLLKFVFISIVSFSIISTVLYMIRGKEIFSTSSRFDLIRDGLRVFFSYPLTGYGFGISRYYNSFGIIPHNIIIQSLVQGGIIYFSSLVVFFSFYLKKISPFTIEFACILLILISSLFIPDIFSSRFALIFFLISSIKLETKQIYFKKSL